MALDPNKELKKAMGFGGATAPQLPNAPSATGQGMRPIGTPGTPTGFGDVTQPRARVDEIAADMMKSDSPLMRQAETRGLQQANRRGLLNSSIAVGEAQRSQLDAVVPMASAEADFRNREVERGFQAEQAELDRGFQAGQAQLDRDQQTQLASFDADTRERLQRIDIESRERLAAMDLDANNRRSAESMITNLLSLEQNTIANIMANTNLSAEERRSQIEAAEQRLRSQMELAEDLFAVDVSQFTAGLAPPPASAAPAASAAAQGGGTWELVGNQTTGLVTLRNSVTGETRRVMRQN